MENLRGFGPGIPGRLNCTHTSGQPGRLYALRRLLHGNLWKNRTELEPLDLSSGSILQCSKNIFKFFAIYS